MIRACTLKHLSGGIFEAVANPALFSYPTTCAPSRDQPLVRHHAYRQLPGPQKRHIAPDLPIRAATYCDQNCRDHETQNRGINKRRLSTYLSQTEEGLESRINQEN
jgi:hypothetical protein